MNERLTGAQELQADYELPEEMRGLPSREAMQNLNLEDKVIIAAFGLRRDGERPYYPKKNSPIEAIFRDELKKGNKFERTENLATFKEVYENIVKTLLGALKRERKQSEKGTHSSSLQAKKLSLYLQDQGFKEGVEISDLRDFAKREIKQTKLDHILLKKQKIGPDPSDLKARGFKLMRE